MSQTEDNTLVRRLGDILAEEDKSVACPHCGAFNNRHSYSTQDTSTEYNFCSKILTTSICYVCQHEWIEEIEIEDDNSYQ